MNYEQFKQEWLGRRIDYDHVYAYQCVDLILEYCKEVCNLPTGIWGNAIDYATHPTPTFAAHFSKVTNGQYQPGDIVVLNGLPGNPYGHIGIFDHQDANGVWLLEQNKNGDATGLGGSAIGVYRAIPLSRVNTVWRFNGQLPPVPMPAPARSQVFLPASAGPWHLYYFGSSYNPNDPRAVKGILRPDLFGGLTYKIVSWVADEAVVIDTQDFGRGVIWVKGTPAQIS